MGGQVARGQVRATAAAARPPAKLATWRRVQGMGASLDRSQPAVPDDHQAADRRQDGPGDEVGLPGVGAGGRRPRSGTGLRGPRLTPMQRLDRLERVTDLLLVLLDTPRPLSLREIADRVPGYPDAHGARRQAFERDKRLLRDEGVPVLVVPIGGEEQFGYRVDPDAYYLPDLGSRGRGAGCPELGRRRSPPGRAYRPRCPLEAGRRRRVAPPSASPAPLVDLPSVDGLPALPVLFDAVRSGAVVRFSYRGERRRWTSPASASAGATGTWSGSTGTGARPAPSGSTASTGRPRWVRRGRRSSRRFRRRRGLRPRPWQFGAGEEIEVDVPGGRGRGRPGGRRAGTPSAWSRSGATVPWWSACR